MSREWNQRALRVIGEMAAKRGLDAQALRLGTNLTFKIGADVIRISRPENFDVARRSWRVSLEIEEIDPGLAPDPLWTKRIDGFDFWAYRFIENIGNPKNFKDIDRARERTQKALSRVSEDALFGIQRWRGPLRSFPIYIEELYKKVPSIAEQLEQKSQKIDPDILQGKWSDREAVIHGDFSAQNCLLTEKGSIVVIDWDCVQKGPYWADNLKLWSRGLLPEEEIPKERIEWVKASVLAKEAFEAFRYYCLASGIDK